MKSILLTTTAIVAFAGAAAADGHAAISHSMSATLGYNDGGDPTTVINDDETGFYWEGNLKTTASAELDNGLTAGAYFEVTIAEDDDTINNDGGIGGTSAADNDADAELATSDFVLSLTSGDSGLYFGDTGTGAEQHWKSAGDMESDGVTTGHDSAALRGDISFGDFDFSVSYLIDEATDSEEQLSVGAAGEFGAFFATLAYQEETTFADSDGDFNPDEIFGISAGGTVGGATVTVAYASNETDDTNSTGIKVAYPFGPVTATAYFVAEEGTGDDEPNLGLAIAYADGPISATLDLQDDQGVSKWKLDGSYDVGNGLTVVAGILNENEGDDSDYYVGGAYDLGGGASLTVSYAMDDDGDQEDEIGAGDWQQGTTVELSFAF